AHDDTPDSVSWEVDLAVVSVGPSDDRPVLRIDLERAPLRHRELNRLCFGGGSHGGVQSPFAALDIRDGSLVQNRRRLGRLVRRASPLWVRRESFGGSPV